MTSDRVIELIIQELKAAEQKHPGWPTDKVHAAGILGEESGEVMKEALDYEYGKTPEKRAIAYQNMIKETAQTGAMAIRILLHMREEGI